MNRNMLIIAIVVIIIAIAVGIFAFSMPQSHDGKLNTEIDIFTESTMKNGDAVKFVLKDEKGNAIPSQNITITFLEDGELQNYSILTDNEGRGALVINNEAPGEYTVIVKYNGTDAYNGCVANQTITVEEGYQSESASSDDGSEPISSNSSAGTSLYNNENSSSIQLHYDSQYNFYYDDNGIIRGGQNDGYAAQYIRDVYESGDMIDEDGNLQ